MSSAEHKEMVEKITRGLEIAEREMLEEKARNNENVIVCGDLNETPISYTYQRLARRLTSAYREKGFGPGFTFSQRSFPVRIDHLFYSSGLECSSCCIDKSVSSSDHYPLIVRLGKKVH